MARVDGAMAAHRTARRRIRVDAVAAVLHGGQAVQRVQQRAGVEDRHQPVAAVSAAALSDVAIDRSDFAAALHTELEANVGLGPAAVREKTFFTREFQLHRAAGGARQRRGDHLEVERLDAVPEAAADKRFDDADLGAVDSQALGDRQVQVVRHLRHRVNRQALRLGLETRHRRVQFDLPMRDLGVVEASARASGRQRQSRLSTSPKVCSTSRSILPRLLSCSSVASGARASAALK